MLLKKSPYGPALAENHAHRHRKNDAGILRAAAYILECRLREGTLISATSAASEYCQARLALRKVEVMACLMLDNKNRLIDFVELSTGDINSAAVHPRNIAVAALNANAASVILTHNHPSGDAAPSRADKAITKRITEALSLLDIRVLDHIIVGRTCYSMADKGLM